jgi:hypothetical protein
VMVHDPQAGCVEEAHFGFTFDFPVFEARMDFAMRSLMSLSVQPMYDPKYFKSSTISMGCPSMASGWYCTLTHDGGVRQVVSAHMSFSNI